ncbi:MAG: FxsA family protein [Eubacteriales bacterium]
MIGWVILFIAVPVAEVVIYIELGHYIGIIPTLAMIFGTGIAGVILAKQQGFYIITRIREEIQSGRVPGNQMLDGLLILAGALLLLTPGLLSDMAGFILLLPFTRVYVREFLKKKLSKWIQDGKVQIYFGPR